ncbi:bifunctional diaminohydroxyphosphoribosylaminopyrimidine deaminase/5-amino-6-(5-phosphoribosylamino)uracil reductase RibD [Streptomyces sp. NPDC096012]|uniref:bifunctional diaminohydroxyphosphoribosylaminopyrimidine deaminase/5-amino-6-(5-phosphoribosylamino)uracil reductase RibD n=1 Tax=Streptomyces sp. NPDC096012 TaxID=3155684 RepID=UPI00336A4721
MRRAVALAASALGRTSPNPVVGCVILGADGSLVGEGFHRGAGRPHAEVEALAVAGERARGGTAVVTLEPCAHQGRTGPCADALLRAGIARVVYAVPDPDQTAAGGARRLRDAGVEVTGGVLRAEAEHGNELWLTAVRRGRPCVTWKFGGTLDGRAAAPDGTSRWITGPESRQDAHALRAAHDAVLVGSGTLRTDDPHLGLRHGVAGTPPLRVVLDRDGTVSPYARVLDDAAPTLVVTGPHAPEPALPGRHEVLRVPVTDDGALDLPVLFDRLWGRGVRSVLLEGGARLAASCVAQGLLDRVVAYVAPVVLGAAARPVLGDFGASTLLAGLRLRPGEVTRLGDDVRLLLRTRELPGGTTPALEHPNDHTDAEPGCPTGRAGPESGSFTGPTGPESGSFAGRAGPESGSFTGPAGPEPGSFAGRTGVESASFTGRAGPERAGEAGRTDPERARRDGCTGPERTCPQGRADPERGRGERRTGPVPEPVGEEGRAAERGVA